MIEVANHDAESMIPRVHQLVSEFDMHTRDQPVLRNIILVYAVEPPTP